jgi:DNA-binding response OmpR family regulator
MAGNAPPLSRGGCPARALRREGYDVEVCEDGPGALESATGSPVDLVVLDLGLPGMDGLEVCRRLRN